MSFSDGWSGDQAEGAMNDFLLTLPSCWVYARCAIAKSMDGFSSLLDKRILPLCGIFYVRYLFALCFYGRVFWGAERLAGLIPGLLTRSIRPPRVPHGWRFSRDRSNKGA
ncbi:hypothetical protein [Nitrosomonas sp.]|uniref:hypothetical protein n=1 Tax=Nitrosomonas sp. TaxID=42353 RepID=UPI0032EF4168